MASSSVTTLKQMKAMGLMEPLEYSVLQWLESMDSALLVRLVRIQSITPKLQCSRMASNIIEFQIQITFATILEAPGCSSCAREKKLICKLRQANFLPILIFSCISMDNSSRLMNDHACQNCLLDLQRKYALKKNQCFLKIPFDFYYFGERKIKTKSFTI